MWGCSSAAAALRPRSMPPFTPPFPSAACGGGRGRRQHPLSSAGGGGPRGGGPVALGAARSKVRPRRCRQLPGRARVPPPIPDASAGGFGLGRGGGTPHLHPPSNPPPDKKNTREGSGLPPRHPLPGTPRFHPETVGFTPPNAQPPLSPPPHPPIPPSEVTLALGTPRGPVTTPSRTVTTWVTPEITDTCGGTGGVQATPLTPYPGGGGGAGATATPPRTSLGGWGECHSLGVSLSPPSPPPVGRKPPAEAAMAQAGGRRRAPRFGGRTGGAGEAWRGEGIPSPSPSSPPPFLLRFPVKRGIFCQQTAVATAAARPPARAARTQPGGGGGGGGAAAQAPPPKKNPGGSTR